MYLNGYKDTFLLEIFLGIMIGLGIIINIYLGDFFNLIYVGLLLFSFPVIIITFVISQNIFLCLNPWHLFKMIAQIGYSYFLLLGLIFIIIASYLLVNYLLGNLIFWFLSFYVVTLIFHILGYIVLQYHYALGYEVNIEYIDINTTEMQPEDLYIAEKENINRLIASGNYTQAIDDLENLLDKDIAFHEIYHNLLQQTGQTNKMVAHASWYLNVLLEHKHYSQAAKLYPQWFALDNNIQPAYTEGLN